MDYLLENRIVLEKEFEYKNLYPWSLQEFSKENQKIGDKQIPWAWRLYFTASELYYIYSIDINSNKSDIGELNQESEIITAVLHSGICRNGKSFDNEVLYSMFGTNRFLNHFDLKICKVKEGDSEKCNLSGGVSYTSEIDFKYETLDDYVTVHIGLSSQRFDKIAELIQDQHIDILEICLSTVSGFYAEWSPSISTPMIKILANSILKDSQEQEVITLEGCEIKPPRLGDVGEFSMSVIQRNKLNLKQDLRNFNIDGLFEEPEDKKDLFEESEYKENLFKLYLAHNEGALKKLYTPVWLIVIAMFIFLLK